MIQRRDVPWDGVARTLAATVMIIAGSGCTGEVDATDSPAAGTFAPLPGPVAVESSPPRGLAMAVLGTGGVVIASSGGQTSSSVDLFMGGNAAPAVSLGQRLSPQPNTVGWFGAGISFSGPEVAISATHDDPDRVQNGYVDLYTPSAAAGEQVRAAGATTTDQGSSDSWVYRETVIPSVVAPPPTSSGSTEFGFGRSLSLSGNDLVVGAGRFAGGFGRVFVFRRADEGSRFAQVAELQESDGARRFDANFGDTVEIQANTLIVTRPDTPASTGDGPKAGKVYVYRRSALETWALQQVLRSPTGDGTWDGFGTAAALSRELIAVRSSHDVWVFAQIGESWRAVWRTAVGRGDRGSIGLGDSYLAVGDPTADVQDATGAGALRVFANLGGGSFGPPLTRTEPTPGSGRGFGARVAIEGSRLLVGISGTAPNDLGRPGAYIESLDRPDRR
jgi:hypothetical protein